MNNPGQLASPSSKSIKIGVMYFRAPAPDDAERYLEEQGLDAVEISLPIRPDSIPAPIRRNIIGCGERLPGRVALHDVIPLAYAHRDREFRKRIARRIREEIEIAIEANIPVITLHTTCTRTKRALAREWRVSHTRWLARALDRDVTPDYEESVEAMVELLGETAPAAAPNGEPLTILAVENNFRDTRFFNRRIDCLDDVLSIIERANHPAVGMCFDIFKAEGTEDSIPDALKKAAPYIVNAHASDATPAETAFFRKRAPLGEGSIDWRGVIKALVDFGYDGPVTFEMMSGDEDVRLSAKRFRALLAEYTDVNNNRYNGER